MLDIITKLPF